MVCPTGPVRTGRRWRVVAPAVFLMLAVLAPLVSRAATSSAVTISRPPPADPLGGGSNPAPASASPSSDPSAGPSPASSTDAPVPRSTDANQPSPTGAGTPDRTADPDRVTRRPATGSESNGGRAGSKSSGSGGAQTGKGPAQALVTTAERAAGLARPLALPLALALGALALLALAMRGPGRLTKVEDDGDGAVFRL